MGRDALQLLPFEFLDMAEQFWRSYRELSPHRYPIDWPRYFLFCHSLELALKAYLIRQGKSSTDARNEFGHRLADLLEACQEQGLSIDAADFRRLSNLAEPHSKFWARYPREDWHLGGIPTIHQFERPALNVFDQVSYAIRGAPSFR
jgi:hypothetical protein